MSLTPAIEKSTAVLTSHVVDEICQPVKQFFKITHFNYRRTYRDGSRALLTNDAPWIIHYYKQSFHQYSTFESKFDEFKSGYTVWNLLENNLSFSKIFTEARNHFNIDQGITITEKSNDYVEFFHFGTSSTHTGNIPKWLAQLDALEKFIQYFKDKGCKLIQASTNCRYASPIIPKLDDGNNNSILNDDPINNNLIYFYLKDEQFVKLSKQESICLFYYLQGKTIQQISQTIKLSPRTIEEYLNNIKRKTNLSNKLAIFKNYNNFHLNSDRNCITPLDKVVNSENNYSSLNEINDFSNSLKIKRYCINFLSHDIYLSKREAECLYQCSLGKSIKEIAYYLNISPRTVEEYLNQVKFKFNLSKKNDLIVKLHEVNILNKIKKWQF